MSSAAAAADAVADDGDECAVAESQTLQKPWPLTVSRSYHSVDVAPMTPAAPK